jgi:hypothetical protein
MSEPSPQTTGDPSSADSAQRQGNAGSDRGRLNNRNRKINEGRHDDEDVPTVLRNYRYDTNNNNLRETFEKVASEVAQYVATEIQGAGYMIRAIINLEEPMIQPPPKPKAPEKPDDEDNEEKYETKNCR